MVKELEASKVYDRLWSSLVNQYGSRLQRARNKIGDSDLKLRFILDIAEGHVLYERLMNSDALGDNKRVYDKAFQKSQKNIKEELLALGVPEEAIDSVVKFGKKRGLRKTG